MEVSGEMNSMQICLDISLVFFHIIPKHAEAHVMTYDEVSQAPAVEGDILFLKRFLDLGFDGVIRWKLPLSEIFQFVKCERNGDGSKTSSMARGWKILSYIMISA
jgi:hypothetical protein